MSWIGGLGPSHAARAVFSSSFCVCLLRTRFAVIATTLLVHGALSAIAAPIIVNVIPSNMNGETDWNAEPNIGVNPSNPSQVLISAFNNGGARPYFITTNLTTWNLYDTLPHNDTTVDWASNGAVYGTRLYNLVNDMPGVHGSIDVQSAANPTGGGAANTFRQIATSIFTTPNGTLNPDQPWIQVDRGAPNRIYVSFNDLSRLSGGNANTATMRQSLDAGLTWNNVLLDNAPVVGQVVNGAAVRLDTARIGNNVYAAFERWTAVGGGADAAAQITVVKDTLGGTLGYAGLGAAGTNVTKSFAGGTGPANVTVPFSINTPGTMLGSRERLGSDLSIAVDPTDPNRLYVAWAQIVGGHSEVQVARSTNGGVNFDLVPQLMPMEESALPSLAVTDFGAVGLLYAAYEPSTGPGIADSLAYKLQQVGPSLGGGLRQTLTRFQDGLGFVGFQPYVGDYFDLEAVGNTFYGTFSAWNDPVPANWPVTGTPIYNRDRTVLGMSVPFSIDPFFFYTAAAVPEPAALTLLFALVIVVACRRRRSAGV